MKTTERIHIVGSGRLGLNLTRPVDCNVFLIDGGEVSTVETVWQMPERA